MNAHVPVLLNQVVEALQPADGERYLDGTFGAGGSTREGTLQTVLDIRAAGYEAAPHISCVAASRYSPMSWSVEATILSCGTMSPDR